MTEKLYKNKPSPLYIQLKEILKSKIENNEFKIGSLMPTQQELSKKLNVSMITVKQAFKELTNEGLIHYVQGKGTFVQEKKNDVSELRIADLYHTESKLKEILFERFQDKFNVKIVVIKTEDSVIKRMEELEQAQQSDKPFDLIFTDEWFTPDLIRKGIAAPIKYSNDFNSIYKSLLDIPSSNNVVFSIPFAFSPVLLFYNKDIFNKDRINYPDEKWNWEMLLNTAKHFTKGNLMGLGIRINLFNRWPVFAVQNNGGIVSEDGTRCLMNSAETVEAIKFLKSLVHEHKVTPFLFDAGVLGSIEDIFAGKNLAMAINTVFTISKYLKGKNREFSFTHLPYSKKRFNHIVKNEVAVSSKSKNPSLAFEFINYLLESETQNIIANEGYLPVRKDILNKHPFLDKKEIKVIEDTLVYAGTSCKEPYSEFLDIFSKCLYGVWQNLETVESGCEKCAEQICRLCGIKNVSLSRR